jgi:glycosyltransferase involved in cell wall biosynthesis
MISIISPMYNEHGYVQGTIGQLDSFMKSMGAGYEIILVDDGSTDGTREKAEEIARDYPDVRITGYPANRGRGYALRHGIAESNGEYVVTIENDLNYGTEIIRRMYDELVNGHADMVIASPYMKGGKVKNVPFKRALLSSIGNRVLRLAVDSKVNTVTGMTRAYRGEVIRRLHLEEDEKEIHLEIVSKASVLGYRIKEIPARLEWPAHKKEKQSPQKKRKSKFKMWKLIRSHLIFASNESPILLFGTLGGLLLLIGLVLGGWLAYLFFVEGQVIGDRIITIMTTIFLLISGFSIFLYAFLAYQMKSIKKELTKIKQMLYDLERKG